MTGLIVTMALLGQRYAIEPTSGASRYTIVASPRAARKVPGDEAISTVIGVQPQPQVQPQVNWQPQVQPQVNYQQIPYVPVRGFGYPYPHGTVYNARPWRGWFGGFRFRSRPMASSQCVGGSCGVR